MLLSGDFSTQGDRAMELLTVTEVSQTLKSSEDFVLKRFGDLPGVIDLGSPELVGRRTGRKRRYRVLRIPRTVLDRFLQDHRIAA
jgi:hypothetical protein